MICSTQFCWGKVVTSLSSRPLPPSCPQTSSIRHTLPPLKWWRPLWTVPFANIRNIKSLLNTDISIWIKLNILKLSDWRITSRLNHGAFIMNQGTINIHIVKDAFKYKSIGFFRCDITLNSRIVFSRFFRIVVKALEKSKLKYLKDFNNSRY